ncbi:mucin-2-like [Macrobrachium rosenbergii]|uniref:mucin-2-like n=1 Tax=Macrobrachium rosenbergii TaxID=79674 RepID=UPI0034D76753
MRLPGCFQVYCARGEWVQIGHVDANCSQCSAYWDPHLVTFDGYYYDYHGTCEYALAQDGMTDDPQYAVNSEFMECWGAACVGPSTFKDSPGTVVKMGAYGRYTPDLYKVLVNGVLYEILDHIPRFVKEGATEHQVLAWRYGYGCIRLLGSSQIAVEKCGSSLSVWASPEFHGKLYGLCGYFDENVDNDFTKRDGTTAALERYPTGVVFPDSWEATCAKGALHGTTPQLAVERMKRNELRGNLTEKHGL